MGPELSRKGKSYLLWFHCVCVYAPVLLGMKLGTFPRIGRCTSEPQPAAGPTSVYYSSARNLQLLLRLATCVRGSVPDGTVSCGCWNIGKEFVERLVQLQLGRGACDAATAAWVKSCSEAVDA